MVDTLRADHMPNYGYKYNTTPNLQKLSKKAVLFKRVIAPSSWTKTSMASIMTSQNPSQHGVRGINDVLPDDLITITEGLSGHGYQTVGVNTNPWLEPKFGFHAGFDIYESIPFVRNNLEREFCDAWRVNQKAMELLAQCSQDKPVFLYLHYMDVHRPYRPKPPYFSGGPLTIPGHGTISNEELDYRYARKGLRGPMVQKRIIELYDGEIRTIDAALEELLDDLGKKPGFENTIFVITSDHGEAFNEHGKILHGNSLYPEVYEVPMIFFWPGGLSGGQEIDVQVSSIDIAPTLFKLAELPVPKSFHGEALLPMKRGSIKERIALSAVGLNDAIPNLDYIAVVSSEYLYIREKINNKIEFYDLQSDPRAHNNLGPSHPKVAFYAKFEGSSINHTIEQAELDQKTIEKLKSFGYLQ
jgi:arylsulfatase A-like enzyme